MSDIPNEVTDIRSRMALVPQPERLDQSLERLRPATRTEFGAELTACLALVAPVGMTEEARREWLAVAWTTVGHLPATLLKIGAQAAREKADHPSKIVPIILAETREMMDRRREGARFEHFDWPALPGPDRCTPEQAREILAEYGLASRFPSKRTA